MKLLRGTLACLVVWMSAVCLQPAAGADAMAPLGPRIEMTEYTNWPSGHQLIFQQFRRAVFDGQDVWMIPAEADQVVKIDPATGVMTGYLQWPAGYTHGNGAFSDGVYDGTSIWMIPSLADRLIRLNPITGAMDGYNSWPSGFTVGSGPKFTGGVYDGHHLWLIPSNANQLVSFDPAGGAMTGYDNWPSGYTHVAYAFSGGVYDGRNVWMIPSRADRLIKFDTATSTMTGYVNWPDDYSPVAYSFSEGIYDGRNIWMIPYSANPIVKFDTVTEEMTSYSDWPSGFDKSVNAFSSGGYDGRYIWLKPSRDAIVIRFDTTTGEMEQYSDWPNGYDATNRSYSFVHDGLNVWMVPGAADRVIRLSSVPALTPIVAGNGQATLSWEPVNGATGYKIYQSLIPATAGSEVESVSGSVYGHTVTGLTNGITYYYRLTALFPGRESAASNEASAIPQTDNADLSGLTLSSGTLSPVFSSATTAYSASVANAVHAVTVTPEAADNEAVIQVNGTAAASGAAFGPVTLNVGNNTIEVEVTAQNGAKKKYTMTVTRAAAASGSTGSGGGGGQSATPSKSKINLNGIEIDPATIDLSKQSVTFEANQADGTVYLRLPATVLTDMEIKNAAFFMELQAPYATFRIPVRLASDIPGLNALLAAHDLKAKDIAFKIKLIDRSSDKELRTRLAAALPKGKVISSIAEYRIEIVNERTGETLKAAEALTSELTRLVPLSSEVPEQWGAFHYNETNKSLEFVPARQVKADGTLSIAMESPLNGIFVVADHPVSFNDMRGHWAKKQAEWAAAKGIVRGVGGGNFAPNLPVTRGEFAAMLARAFGTSTSSEIAAPSDRPLTREEMAGMLAVAIPPDQLGSVDPDAPSNDFKDRSSVNPVYSEAVRTMVRLNVMRGVGGNRFLPQAETTRAQAATVLVNMLIKLNRIDDIH